MNGSLQFAGGLVPVLTHLQQHLDQLFGMDGSSNIRALASGAFPAVNIGSTPETVEVIAFAPGADPKALQITIDKGLLVISGERVENREQENGVNTYAQERFTGKFRRVITLPEDADPSQVDATFRDGILRVSVTKRESAKPRQITVN